MGNAPDGVQQKQNQVQRNTGMCLAGLGIRLHGFIRMYPTLLFDHYRFATSGEKHPAAVTSSFCSTGGLPAARRRALQTTAKEISAFSAWT